MKIAIMQPYFLPYIGYFQLIKAVDKFVIYDDVNYIKKGWINRNQILIQGVPSIFTIPLEKASQNKLICETYLTADEKWKGKLLQTIENNYCKSVNYKLFYPIVESIINYKSRNISDYNLNSIKTICEYLQINTEIVSSSKIYENQQLKGEARIIDICVKEGAETYINPSGGINLYDAKEFEKKNIALDFHRADIKSYKQMSSVFSGGLSIIDVLMNETVIDEIKSN